MTTNQSTVNTETTEPIVAGINLDTLTDADLMAITAQLKSRAEAQAPVKLARLAELKAQQEVITTEVKGLMLWCHTHNVRIPRERPDGSADPDTNTNDNPAAKAEEKRGPGRPKKDGK